MNTALRNRPFLNACMVEIVLLLLGIGLVPVLRVPVAHLLPWHFDWVLVGLACTVPLLVVLIWLMKTSWSPVIRVRSFLDEVVRPLLGQLSVFQLLLLAILAGVAEEWLFRAFLQTWISGMLSPAAGLIVASLIFGVCHLVTPFYGVFATAMGFYLGALMMFSGSIWPPVIVHGLYDFVALIWILKIRASNPGKEEQSVSNV